MKCYFCGQPLGSLRNTYSRVVGWERDRTQGGTNALALREPLHDHAHADCIDKAKRGLAAGQASLV